MSGLLYPDPMNIGIYPDPMNIRMGIAGSSEAPPLFEDDFNRADGLLGANWLTELQSGDFISIVNNKMRGNSVNSGGYARYSGVTPANQMAQITAEADPDVLAIYLILRYTNTSVFYRFGYEWPDDTWKIQRRNGSYVTLDSQAEVEPSLPYIIRFSINGTALSGGVVVDGEYVEKCSAIDATHASGQAGVLMVGGTAAIGDADDFKLWGL
jgi:hypothetical protein